MLTQMLTQICQNLMFVTTQKKMDEYISLIHRTKDAWSMEDENIFFIY